MSRDVSTGLRREITARVRLVCLAPSFVFSSFGRAGCGEISFRRGSVAPSDERSSPGSQKKSQQQRVTKRRAPRMASQTCPS